MGPIEVRWRDHRGWPFIARLTLERLGDRLEVTELAVYSPNRDRIVDGRLLRDLHIPDLVAQALREFQRRGLPYDLLIPGQPLNASEIEAEHPGFLRRRDEAWAAAPKDYVRLINATPSGPGRRYPADHLRRVAEVYIDARRRHEAPTKAVAEAFDISPAAAKKQVYRARRGGHLPKTTQGKASGRKAASPIRRKKR